MSNITSESASTSHDEAYAVAHTAMGCGATPSDAPLLSGHADATVNWPRIPFSVARERLARGPLVYSVSEVVALLKGRAEALEAEAEASERRREALQVTVTIEAGRAPRARVEEMRRVIARVAGLADGDVPTARALCRDLSVAAASDAKRSDAEFGRAQASAEGAATIQRCLIPRCITWSGSFPSATEGDLDLLARVMAGVPDVRCGGGSRGGWAPPMSAQTAEGSTGWPVVRPVSREAWRAMLAEDDARRPVWDEPHGVLLFRPEEVADLLKTEARLYEEAADRLRATRGCDGEGEALAHLAADLRREVPRVCALDSGDVAGARALLTALRREQRDHTRTRRRALWRRSVAHLDVVAELVEDLLLPLVVDGPGYVRVRGGVTEREIYRRWDLGVLDVRDEVSAHEILA